MAMALLVATGCSGGGLAAQAVGPSAEAQEAALEIVWEGVYGMERESRPTSITWWPTNGCGEDLDVTGLTLEGACVLDAEGSKGDVYIRWKGSIAASTFSRALVMWRQFLLTGQMTRPSAADFTLVTNANAALGSL